MTESIKGTWLMKLLPSLAVALVSIAVTWAIASYQNTAAVDAVTQHRIQELESQLALLKQSVAPFSAVMQDILIKKLTHYHTPVMDELMVKLQKGELSEAGERKLLVALEERTQNVGGLIGPEERVAAAMLPFVMQQVKQDREEMKTNKPSDDRMRIVLLPTDVVEQRPDARTR